MNSSDDCVLSYPQASSKCGEDINPRFLDFDAYKPPVAPVVECLK